MRKPKPFLLIVLSLLIYFSCRKHDSEITAFKPESSFSIERFFNLPASADPRLKAIAQSIRKQEKEHPFLEKFIKGTGWPLWDKSKIIKPSSFRTGRTTDDDSSTFIYIPFVIDNFTVNAVLSVNMNVTDTLWRTLYANSYQAFGFDSSNTNSWNAQDVF